MNNPIGIIDSGIGGLSIASVLIKTLSKVVARQVKSLKTTKGFQVLRIQTIISLRQEIKFFLPCLSKK